MCPNECLEEVRELLRRLRSENDESQYHYDPDLERLAERFEELDNHLRNGGPLPEAWTRTKVRVHPGTAPTGHVELKKTRR